MRQTTERTIFSWRLRRRSLELGRRTLVMGVLNVTPDSFSDGGRYFSATAAIEHGLRLLEAGADILDIGGESTRPCARVRERGVSEAEELRRVLPVIAGVIKARPEAVISLDTYKSGVAKIGAAAGAEIVNDISGGSFDPALAGVAAEAGCGVVLAHMRGLPENWRALPRLGGDEMLALVSRELDQRAQAMMAAGVERERIVLDPGFGFGKNFEENYPLLGRLRELTRLGFPLLAGTSRKGFVGRLLARDGNDAPAGGRLFGTLATVAIAIMQGAHIVRVHDVQPALEVARACDAILAAS